MNNHRNTVTTMLRLQRSAIDRLKSDSTYRVMVFCGADTGLGMFSRMDVAFPHQVELKVNQDDVKANLRGLKNKPGSTRPADVTDHLHKSEKYENTISMTYALTHKVSDRAAWTDHRLTPPSEVQLRRQPRQDLLGSRARQPAQGRTGDLQGQRDSRE